jgi:hypothetical protein
LKKVLFKEIQSITQGWNLILILGTHIPLLIFFCYALYEQTVKGLEIGDNPAPNWALVLLIITMVGTLWGSLVMKLEVWIDQDGFHYRFFPIVFKEKLISKAEIQQCEIRKYSAILDYGGWGLRRGIGRKWGKGYIVSGDTGLQLYLTNGKKVLFTTQRSQAIIYAMDEMMKIK